MRCENRQHDVGRRTPPRESHERESPRRGSEREWGEGQAPGRRLRDSEIGWYELKLQTISEREERHTRTHKERHQLQRLSCISIREQIAVPSAPRW